MANPRDRGGAPPSEDTSPGLEDELFVETPTAPSAPRPEDLARGEELPMIAEPLPEMSAEIWQAGVQALVSVGDDPAQAAAFPAPDAWAEEARLYQEESELALAGAPVEAATLLSAAARAALFAGDLESAAGLLDRAFELDPNAPDVLRARARLAETAGDLDGASALWARLAAVSESADERALYSELSVEWALARRGTLSASARAAIPAGPARSLAVAEAALRAGAAADAAEALADAGNVVGGALGAVLLEQGARLEEAGGERVAAAVARAAARKLEPEASAEIFGRLRDAARADDKGGARLFAALAQDLPADSTLGHAVARTAVGLARRRGDVALADTLIERLSPATTAAARDRIDADVAHGVPLDGASLERLRADVRGPAGAATLAWIEASSLVARGEPDAARAVLARGIEESPDAVSLGLIAEQIASAEDEPGARAAALELWLRTDPARRPEAALALAAAREALPGTEAAMAARAALGTAIEAAPESALFWKVAAGDARAGRRADAAAVLEYGAQSWAASTLAAGLRAAAASQLAPSEPGNALALLAGGNVARAFGAEARARLATRAEAQGTPGAREVLRAALEEALAAAGEPAAHAFLSMQRAILDEDETARARALDRALSAVADDPLALPLRLADESLTASQSAAILWGAGEAGSRATALGQLYRFAATSAAELGEDGDDALRRASELVDAAPGDRAAHLALVRAASRLDPDRRSRAIAELPANPGADPTLGLVVAEALAEAGAGARAAFLLRELRVGPFAAEARRFLARLEAEGGESAPPAALFGAADETAAVIRAELRELTDAARGGQWDAVVASLESGPPHEAVAGSLSLHAAALIAAGRGSSADAVRLESAALDAARTASAVAVMGLGRLAQGGSVQQSGSSSDANVSAQALGLAAQALGLAARRFSDQGAPRAVALVQAALARLREATGESERAIESWRAALEADPSFLSAALALRREVARRGDLRAAVDATEVEASCLRVPEQRVRALLLAASLAEEASRGAEAASGRGRALRLLRAALAIDPAHEAAFEQLRSLLEEEQDWVGLAAAFEARIAVAGNPFEVTSLRLARADVLAGKLRDRAGARSELDAILHKQPEHARALGRLSELLWEEEAWNEAGEVYLRRAVVEREPRTLREVFLRLGHIYWERVPDPKRAVTAYERVRGLEPDNREALRALSELYVREGDSKQALPVTDRLVTIEVDSKRRNAARVRLGELLTRTGDLRRASQELRAVVDANPRDLAAVSALAQLLERARDPSGRRALLDHTVGLLRHDVERGIADLETLRGLVGLLTLRERPRAAAAVTQLVEALAPGGSGGPAGTPRRLAALARPEVDDQAFPPGLPPGVRQMMKIAGPLFRPTGPELARALERHGVTRAERIGRGSPPRPPFEGVAAELHVAEFDLFVRASAAAGGPAAVRVEPGTPPAIILGSTIAERGAAALRFAAARTLRLVSTGLDVLLSTTAEEAAALVVGIIRQFVPEYRHPGIRDALLDLETARAARIVPRKLRPQLMPFAVEAAGQFDPVALHAAVRDAANFTGLLAVGDLPVALSVVLAASGAHPSGAHPGGHQINQPLTIAALVAHPEALALLRFAVSDDYEELAAAME